MPNVAARLRPVVSRTRAALHRPSSLARAVADHRALGDRIRTQVVSRERAVPLTVAGLVLVASVLSVAPVSGVRGSAGADVATAPRLLAGGGVLGDEPPVQVADPGTLPPGVAADQAAGVADALAAGGQYLSDGTLLKPVAVDTSVPDSSGRLVDYTVKAGDTLTGIAHQFGISMMTLWWANHLAAKDQLHVGQHLVVPPVDGLVVTVKVGDTLDAIAKAGGVDPAVVADYNGLTDGTVVVGQVLILPGGHGAAIATPTPKPTPKPATVKKSSSGTVIKTPSSSYSGGKFYWPLPGHPISQYYHYGHYGLDIAGRMGDDVHAAAAGTVIYAGWSNLGGGNVVWVSHGSGLYTTYNHMSAILVHTGQKVTKGQVVGRVGMTGWATGPHLHFEVWLGGVPGGVDRRVNPLRYY